MIEVKKFGNYKLQAVGLRAETGWRGGVVVVRCDPRPELVVFVQYGVGYGFVFSDSKAAIRYAFDVGAREASRLEGGGEPHALLFPESTN